MSDEDEIALSVNGASYSGWKDVSVTRSIEGLAHSFSIGFSERWTDQDEAIPIEPGGACTVSIDDETIITGYVDDDEIEYDAQSHRMSVSGRAKPGDLVDCSAIYKTGQWRNQPVLAIAKNICDPFGISVRGEVDLGANLRKFSIQDGESCFEALDRLARMRGTLLVCDSDGNIAFTRRGLRLTSTVLKYGANIKAAARAGSWRDRFSQYTVQSQQVGDDQWSGASAAKPKATVLDRNVGRYRPLVVVAEDQGSKTELEKRAKWERNVRAGRALRYRCTVQGWRNAEGLWAPNILAHVVDPRARLDDDLLVVAARLVRNDGGRTTELEMTLPQAFDVLELPEKRESLPF